MSAASRVQRLLVRSQPGLCDTSECGVCVSGAPKGGGYRCGLPPELPAQSPAGVILLDTRREKKKNEYIKMLNRRPFPTRLGSHRLLSKGEALQKENDGNLHVQHKKKHTLTHYIHYLSMSRSPSLQPTSVHTTLSSASAGRVYAPQHITDSVESRHKQTHVTH